MYIYIYIYNLSNSQACLNRRVFRAVLKKAFTFADCLTELWTCDGKSPITIRFSVGLANLKIILLSRP